MQYFFLQWRGKLILGLLFVGKTVQAWPPCSSGAGQCMYCPNDQCWNRICKTCSHGTFSHAGLYCSKVLADGLGICKPCPEGFYADANGSSSCTACPAGSFSDQKGASTKESCVSCSKGSYAKKGASSCTECSEGFYADEKGAGSCIECLEGSYANQKGATSCAKCSAGSYAEKGASSCTACSEGFYADEKGAGSCIECPEGSYANQKGATSCAKCSAGSHAEKGASSCTACSEGFYADEKGAGSCVPCPEGSFANQKGSTSCLVCSAGSYAEKGASSCTACSEGSYADEKGAGSCIACPKGSYANQKNASSCAPCSEGFYSEKGAKLCKAYAGSCLHGHLKILKDRTQENHCGSCDPGYHLHQQHCRAFAGSCEHGDLIAQKGRTQENHCGSCEGGYRLHDKQCELCPEGRFSNQGVHEQCELCTEGTYSFQGVCTGCNLLQWILNQKEWNPTMHRPRDLHGCKETAIFRLINVTHFRNRRNFAVALKELDASFYAMEQGKTLIEALVEHCDTDTEMDLQELLNELIENKVNLKTGSPMEVAKKNGCHGLFKIIKENSIPEGFWERLEYLVNHSTRLFVGPKLVASISLKLSVLTACVSAFGVGVLTPILLRMADDIEQQVGPCTGAREMAALAHCLFWEERLQRITGFLSVVARVVFPLHVCMSTITPALFLLLYSVYLVAPTFFQYFLYLVLPTFVHQRQKNNFASLRIPSHASCSLLLRVIAISWQLFLSSLSGMAEPSIWAILGPISLYILSALVAASGVESLIEQRAKLVPWLFQLWYWMRARAMKALQFEHGTVRNIRWMFGNIRCGDILDPYNLADIEHHIHTRTLYCCFEPLVGYLSAIWCILSLYLWIKNRRVDTHMVQPDLQALAEMTQSLAQHKQKKKLTELTGVEGVLGKFQRRLLEAEKRLTRGQTSASHFTMKASSDDVDETRFVREVRSCSTYSIRMDWLWYGIGMIFDLLQIVNLYWNIHPQFGGVMLFLFIWVLTVQLVRGDICALIKEKEEIYQHGMKTETYMRIMRWEKGFESSFKLMFTAYYIHFSITEWFSLLTGFAGLFFSIWAFATYMFQKGYLKSKYDALTAQHALESTHEQLFQDTETGGVEPRCPEREPLCPERERGLIS